MIRGIFFNLFNFAKLKNVAINRRLNWEKLRPTRYRYHHRIIHAYSTSLQIQAPPFSILLHQPNHTSNDDDMAHSSQRPSDGLGWNAVQGIPSTFLGMFQVLNLFSTFTPRQSRIFLRSQTHCQFDPYGNVSSTPITSLLCFAPLQIWTIRYVLEKGHTGWAGGGIWSLCALPPASPDRWFGTVCNTALGRQTSDSHANMLSYFTLLSIRAGVVCTPSEIAYSRSLEGHF